MLLFDACLLALSDQPPREINQSRLHLSRVLSEMGALGVLPDRELAYLPNHVVAASRDCERDDINT